MNLPRNIVQIGEPDKYHRIFIEDYVLSYIKQSIKANQETLNVYGRRGPRLVLYGQMQEENDVTYYFLYAAALLTSTPEQENYLNQEERKEAEELRLQFFGNYKCRAFCVLGEELPEGFYVLEGMKGRFVNGYACFYEKNDCMLSYMLLKKGPIKPEKVKEILQKPVMESHVSGNLKNPEEKRKIAEQVSEGKRWPPIVRAASMWFFIVLCIIGITAINDADKLESWKDMVVKGFETIGEQKLPDKEVVNLTDETKQVNSGNVILDVSEEELQSIVLENGQVASGENAPEMPTETTDALILPEETPVVSAGPEEVKEPEVYVIVRGDTLLSISRKKYGTVEMVREICELNQITNPDSIQIGQTILLP